MNLSSFDQGRKAALIRQMAIVVFGIVLFYAAICTPVNIWINSDILIAETLFPTVWDFVIELVNYAFYWSAFSYLLYIFFRFETRQTTLFFGRIPSMVTTLLPAPWMMAPIERR